MKAKQGSVPSSTLVLVFALICHLVVTTTRVAEVGWRDAWPALTLTSATFALAAFKFILQRTTIDLLAAKAAVLSFVILVPLCSPGT